MIHIEIVNDDGVKEKQCDTYDEAINYLTALSRKEESDRRADDQAIEDARDNGTF